MHVIANHSTIPPAGLGSFSEALNPRAQAITTLGAEILGWQRCLTDGRLSTKPYDSIAMAFGDWLARVSQESDPKIANFNYIFGDLISRHQSRRLRLQDFVKELAGNSASGSIKNLSSPQTETSQPVHTFTLTKDKLTENLKSNLHLTFNAAKTDIPPPSSPYLPDQIIASIERQTNAASSHQQASFHFTTAVDLPFSEIDIKSFGAILASLNSYVHKAEIKLFFEELIKVCGINPQDPQQLVSYSDPRFVPEFIIEQAQTAGEGLVIDFSKRGPQAGFAHVFNYQEMSSMLSGRSAKFCSLELNNQLEGFWFMTLDFMLDSRGNYQDTKQAAQEHGLLANRNCGFVFLMGACESCRNYYRENGDKHAYKHLLDSVRAFCAQNKVNRLLGEIRMGDNPNQAWKAHQREGWKMVEGVTLMRNGYEYGLMYLDL